MCELNISLTQIKKKQLITKHKTKNKLFLVKVLNEEHILSSELSFIFVKLDNTVRIGLV